MPDNPVEAERIDETATKKWHEQIAGAVARGWCSPENAHKTMDTDLALAITKEIEDLLKTDVHPKLGCATTRALIEEIAARVSIDLGYRTTDT